ncbi:sensor histidine kinase [Clostridium sediminicola]|uniref:LytS/YhcK type 5TM receptor domain-containing protein n=1 Tax=Clostridium sediminicola TaxID=3114879 RepID=UPI0031F1F0DE
MVELLKTLINNLGYVILIVFIISRINSFKKIIQRDTFKKTDLIILSLIFGGFGVVGTYIGTEVNGAIANNRIIGVMSGGILCGPFVGTVAGLIAGIHRFIINPAGITSVPCSITTITAGIFSGIIYKYADDSKKWFFGLIAGILMESMEMILILVISKPFEQAVSIVKSIYFPMGFTNAIGIWIVIILIQGIFKEKETIAAKQAQLALEIANKTMPYFREINSQSYSMVCKIIKDSVGADAVSITDKNYILAHVGIGEDHHFKGQKILTSATAKAIKSGELLVITDSRDVNCPNDKCPIKSGIISPLKEGNEVIGALKLYYSKSGVISFRDRSLVNGLSQIISTQLQISKVGKLKEMANKAEIKALQTQINPHFLFNALNTITSFVRINPNKARELIINLSSYLRYNLDVGDELVDIYKEIDQVNAYIEIEKARFGEKLNFICKVDENIDIKIPSLIIQPLVENSVKHGLLQRGDKGYVILIIKKINKDNLKIIIEDDGVGIPEEIIEKVYAGKMKENNIGLSNVYNRLKILYGDSLNFEKVKKGTRISFHVCRRGDK